MSSVHVSSESATGSELVKSGETRLEVVTVARLRWRSGEALLREARVAARPDISRDIEVTEVFRFDGGRVPGPDSASLSYRSYAAAGDLDGNGWLLQEIKERLPGR